MLEISEILLLRRELMLPVVIDFVRVRIDSTRNVDSCTGIAILEPRPADSVVLLEHGEVEARLLELHGRVEAVETCADDDDLKLCDLLERAVRPFHPPRHLLEGELLQPDVELLLGYRHTDRQLHCGT
jgi:hypothetical protein